MQPARNNLVPTQSFLAIMQESGQTFVSLEMRQTLADDAVSGVI
jgi:hypothetical protein